MEPPDVDPITALAHANLDGPVDIAPRTFWVGTMLEDVTFQSHTYLIEQADQSVLIDPGSALAVDAVIAKVNEVVGLANVRWLVCSNTDPDVVGGLARLVEAGLHPEAALVTHRHDEMLLVHTGTRLPFWRIEEHDWRLELEDRALRFDSIPYAVVAGAFVTFDESTGVLFSSNLFGGETPEGALVARSMDYYDAIRPFHQHFVPSREVLAHALARVAKLPVTLVAPPSRSVGASRSDRPSHPAPRASSVRPGHPGPRGPAGALPARRQSDHPPRPRRPRARAAVQ